MELSTFIATTLTEIQAGVQTAIHDTKNKAINGAINPTWVHQMNEGLIQKVDFDIAVTVSDRKGGALEGGIKVVGVHLGGKGEQGSETSHVSRIRFSIPVIPPATRLVEEEVE